MNERREADEKWLTKARSTDEEQTETEDWREDWRENERAKESEREEGGKSREKEGKCKSTAVVLAHVPR